MRVCEYASMRAREIQREEGGRKRSLQFSKTYRIVYIKGKFKVHRTNDQSMYRNVLFLNYAQIAINTNVSETSKLGDISVFWLP